MTTIIGTTIRNYENVSISSSSSQKAVAAAAIIAPANDNGEHPLVAKFRQELLKRNVAGIKSIGMTFRQLDDNSSGTLSLFEFKNGLMNHNLRYFKEDEMETLFGLFDKNGEGYIDYDEFILQVRPPMNTYRLELVKKAFKKIDKSGDDKITIDDLKGVYNVRMHPKFINGDWTEEKCLLKFLEKFEADKHVDGAVTMEEFNLYCKGKRKLLG